MSEITQGTYDPTQSMFYSIYRDRCPESNPNDLEALEIKFIASVPKKPPTDPISLELWPEPFWLGEFGSRLTQFEGWLTPDKCPPPPGPTGTTGSEETQGVGSAQPTGTQALARRFKDAEAYAGLLPDVKTAEATWSEIPWYRPILNGVGYYVLGSNLNFVPAGGTRVPVGFGVLAPVSVGAR